MHTLVSSSKGLSSVIPTVSFIMGVYCCKDADALQACVESVIRQTFTDWEFLIVDDGSPDCGATYRAIQNAAALDDRVTALRYTENMGLSFALNFCLARARGRYIARQDDSDLSESNRLAEQVSFLDSHPEYDILGTNALLFDAQGEWGNLMMPEVPSRKDFLWNSPFIHPSVVMRASALRAVGGYRVSAETKRGQDYDLFMRMYAQGSLGFNLQAMLYRYRSERGVSKYRSMPQRVDEARVRARGFRALGFDSRRYLYVIKPLLLGMVPRRLYGTVQKWRTQK